jgi:hypothetical protein
VIKTEATCPRILIVESDREQAKFVREAITGEAPAHRGPYTDRNVVSRAIPSFFNATTDAAAIICD